MERLIYETAANLIASAVKRCMHAPRNSEGSLICRPCTETLVAGLLAAAPELQK